MKMFLPPEKDRYNPAPTIKSLHKKCDSWLNFIVMHDLEFHICDNLKYSCVNDDKCLEFSDCLFSHFHVIVTT